MSWRPKRFFQLVVTIAVLGSLYFAWERFTGTAPAQKSAQTRVASQQAVPVSVDTARIADFPVELQGLGQVQAFNTVTIHSRVDGQIEQVYFKEGQTVQQGDPLVQIDPAPFQATLDQAKAKLTQDQANLHDATLDLGRFQTLAKQNAATEQQLNSQQALVSSDTGLIQADQAAIDAAQIQLNYTKITAPISGRVGFRLVDSGNIVHASDPGGILTITQVQPIFVVYTAPGDQIDRINEAMQAGPVQVTALSDDGSRTLDTGTLTVVNNQVDPSTETVQLKATFANAKNALWPGLAVNTKTLVTTLKNVLVIPGDAVQHGQSGLYAFVLTNDNKVAAKPIEVSQSGGDLSVVTRGLATGDRVVTSGSYRLQDGTPVTVNVAENNAPQDRTP
ncbi:MAG TPA: efflux RND transporter periplasmic adaptor subunit [Beijerinckiaceae bacterium]|jgi:multidrug efflux system membrane fusion protein|nr:efflux RND transporter periplasmic adaptor subunit [Beijerinckiaceae bacterium]